MHKLGINGSQPILSLYRCNWVCQYATAAATCSKPTNFMVEYLVNSLGFSKEQALLTSSKVSHFKSTEKSISVVDFFKTSGFDQTQIKDMVLSEPLILSCNVDKTLKPKIDALLEMGFSGSDLAHVLSACPNICTRRSLNEHIIPTIEVLKSVFGDDEVLIRALKKTSWLFGPTVKKQLPEVVSLLKSYGLSDDRIRAFALKKPRYLVMGPKMLQPVLIRVEERLGIPRDSPMFVHGMCALCSLSEENLELRMGVYKSFGFTEADVLTLGRKNPYALMISESKLKRCLHLFLNDMGYQPAELATMPHLLTFSLEKRVIPRYRIWKALNEKGLRKIKSSLAHCLTIVESDFLKRFVLPFKDQIPDLCNDYVKNMHSTLKYGK